MRTFIRKWYRRFFQPEPFARLDGIVIKAMTVLNGMSWEDAAAERGRQNRARREAWKRGEDIL